MANIAELESIHKGFESGWTKRMAEFEERLNAAESSSNPNIAQLISEEFYSFRNMVSDAIGLIRQQIQACVRVVDAIDQRQRQKVLLFYGIPEASDSDVAPDIINVIHNNMGLPEVTNSSLMRCHRLGALANNRSRPVLVQFTDRNTKSSVWNLKSKLKGTEVTVSEFLTRTRQIVHQKARKHFGPRNVWTLDGTINIKLPNGRREKICTEEEFYLLSAKHPGAERTDSTSEPLASASTAASTKYQDRRKIAGISAQVEDKRSRRAVSKK